MNITVGYYQSAPGGGYVVFRSFKLPLRKACEIPIALLREQEEARMVMTTTANAYRMAGHTVTTIKARSK